MARCEDCIHFGICKKGFPFSDGKGGGWCENFYTADVVPKSEVEKLELTLQGVMWSVDKWLDETDYDADPIKRAIAMREKTLKIVENAKAEIAKEIFEEIAKIFGEHMLWYRFTENQYQSYVELKKKYEVGKDG